MQICRRINLFDAVRCSTVTKPTSLGEAECREVSPAKRKLSCFSLGFFYRLLHPATCFYVGCKIVKNKSGPHKGKYSGLSKSYRPFSWSVKRCSNSNWLTLYRLWPVDGVRILDTLCWSFPSGKMRQRSPAIDYMASSPTPGFFFFFGGGVFSFLN